MGSAGHSCARSRVARRRLGGLLLAAAALACATQAPPPPIAGTGTVWGTLRLVPREGVKPVKAGGSPYGDRRMSDVEFVDYSKPGFAVVHLGEGPSPAGSAELAIRTTGVRTRLDPAHVAVGAGGVVVVSNGSGAAHVLSAPAMQLVRRLEPGQQIEIAVPEAGEQSLFLLDVPRSEATVFVSPGPFVVVATDGRFELSGLAPGDHTLLAWHPRFPPARAPLQIAPDSVVHLDLEMGVDQRGDVPASAPADQP
jgi:hypothetical protein